MRFLLLLFVMSIRLHGQTTLYFPPHVGTWQTIDPVTLGWCQEKMSALDDFLMNSGTKGFIILQDGKILYERYFNGHSTSTNWYWASAGKTITTAMIGIAQQQGLLNIEDPLSDYLGAGWSVMTTSQEQAVRLRHLLSMTSGLNDNPVVNGTQPGHSDPCEEPACFQFLADTGSRWAYHNAIYLRLGKVIENVFQKTYTQATNEHLMSKIGGQGFWYNGVYFSNTRTMARFGLLNLAGGFWQNGTEIIQVTDSVFTAIAHQPSQQLNKSYGYLWWLNGQQSFMLPGSQFVFDGMLVAKAPADTYMALGKNDQKIHVVPSKNWVVVRMGESASSSPVPISFDNTLWEYLNDMTCPNGNDDKADNQIQVKLNYDVQNLEITWPEAGLWTVELVGIDGRVWQRQAGKSFVANLRMPHAQGLYILSYMINGQRGSITVYL